MHIYVQYPGRDDGNRGGMGMVRLSRWSDFAFFADRSSGSGLELARFLSRSLDGGEGCEGVEYGGQ